MGAAIATEAPTLQFRCKCCLLSVFYCQGRLPPITSTAAPADGGASQCDYSYRNAPDNRTVISSTAAAII